MLDYRTSRLDYLNSVPIKFVISTEIFKISCDHFLRGWGQHSFHHNFIFWHNYFQCNICRKCKPKYLSLSKTYNLHYILIISQLWLTSHPRSTVVLLGTGAPGTSREIYSKDADDGLELATPRVLSSASSL